MGLSFVVVVVVEAVVLCLAAIWLSFRSRGLVSPLRLVSSSIRSTPRHVCDARGVFSHALLDIFFLNSNFVLIKVILN